MSLVFLAIYWLLFKKELFNISLPLLFYGASLEIFLLTSGIYSSETISYISYLGIILCVYFLGNRIKTRSRPIIEIPTINKAFVFFTALMIISYLAQFSSRNTLIELTRAEIYYSRQNGNPLYDLFLFQSLFFGGLAIIKEPKKWKIALIILLIPFPLSLGDRRVLLVAFLPIFFSNLLGFSIFKKGILMISVYLLFVGAGFYRTNIKLSQIDEMFAVDLMGSNEPYLIYNVANDLKNGRHFGEKQGATYLDSLLLCIPSSFRPGNVEPLPHWYTKRYRPELYKAGNTVAFSPIAEGYLNFGNLSIIAIIPWFLVGLICSQLLSLYTVKGVSGMALYWTFCIPRFSFSNIIKDCFFLFIVFVILYLFQFITRGDKPDRNEGSRSR